MIEPQWEFKITDEDSVINVADIFDLPKIIARIMSIRGITSRSCSKVFFYPNIGQLHDPFLMKDMEQAVNRIITAIVNKQTILIFGDYDSTNEYRTSPAGDYGLIFSSSADSATNAKSCGLVFYQAGVVVLTSSMFSRLGTGHVLGVGGDTHDGSEMDNGSYFGMNPNIWGSGSDGGPMKQAITGATIQQLTNGFRHRIQNISFNNTIELNSAIYFCRVNHNEYNYSANPTYISGSKLVVKNNVNDLPITYITTVGLYSSDNELLAVAKLSEPIRKDPNTELTLRVRLDY